MNQAECSYWIPIDLYPHDGRLRVLLLSRRDGVVSIPAIGYRVNGVWSLRQPATFGVDVNSYPIPTTWIVTGWQEIQTDGHAGVTDQELRDDLAALRSNSRTNTPLFGDLVGWFRKRNSALVAELIKLKVTKK